MQKTLICLKRNQSDQDTWNTSVAELVNEYADQFQRCGFAIRDQDVAPAHLLEMIYTGHPCDALISIWCEHTYDQSEFFAAASGLGELQAYGVMESSAIPFDAETGRVPGMCQVAFIRKPEEQARQDWLNKWLGDHTRIAIDTQSNFAYRQNVVATVLPYHVQDEPKWPLMDAIVEENFPAIAMTSREAFFDAEGDADKFEEHQQIMMQSCGRFIDFAAFDCVPMSMYMVKV